MDDKFHATLMKTFTRHRADLWQTCLLIAVVIQAVGSVAQTNSPVIATQPTSQTVIVGDNTTFSVIVLNSSPSPSYQWFFNDSAITKKTNSVLQLREVQLTNQGDYYVTISNAVGWVTSSVASLTVTNGALKVTKIAAGFGHSLLLKANGSLWTMGAGADGQLGNGIPFSEKLPKQIVTEDVTVISAGYAHSLFIKSDGSLWGMGDNRELQLGFPIFIGQNNYEYHSPAQIQATSVSKIACGQSYSLFINSGRYLYGMGYNQYGESGAGGAPPNLVTGITNITDVSAKYSHSLFLRGNGSLWGMGRNFFGELGNGTTNNMSAPGQIVPSNFVAIATGAGHSLFLKNDGSVWGMGSSRFGQLGDGTTNNSLVPKQIVAGGVTAIAAGYVHTLFIKSDGSLWGMGYNFYGQLGDGTTNNALEPKLISADVVTAIAAGAEHSLFVKSDGSLWSMGWNYAGQLGDGTTNDSRSPRLIVAMPNPVITNQPISRTVVVGSNVTFSVGVAGLSPMAFQWLFNGAAIGNGTNSSLTIANATLSNSGSYQVIVTNSFGADTSVVATLTAILPPDYNQISGKLLGGNVRFSFVGLPGATYALDRSFSLAPPVWVPLATNTSSPTGALLLTNTPVAGTNNFWRVRSMP